MENKTENRLCLKCGGETPHYHNKGISKKTGKPYENYKCSVCQETEWVNSDQKPPYQPKPYQPKKIKGDEPNWEEINARKEEGMIFLNAKNCAAVLVAAGIKAGWYANQDEAIKDYDTLTQKIYEIGKGE